jgi:hypothetical protein
LRKEIDEAVQGSYDVNYIKGGLMVKNRLIFIFCMLFIMCGCAGQQMALTKGQANIDVTKKSIALLSVKISNQFKPGYQFDVVSTQICPQNEECGRNFYHRTKTDYKIKSVEDSFNEYLLSYELDSGAYKVAMIGALYNHFPICGGGIIPLNFKTEIKPNSVVYWGHLDVVMRERKNDNEVRAGSVFPLIDQAVVGCSSGTFDVVVEDKYEEDMKLFVSEYPAMKNVKVEPSILPQWTRPENLPTN